MSRARNQRRSRNTSRTSGPEERSSARETGWHPWILLSLLLINWIAYANSFQTGWHFDDGRNIVENPDIQISDLSWKSLRQAASSSIGGRRPVSYLTFALNYYWWDLDPLAYHVVNFLIHCLNAVLVFQIFSTLIENATRANRVDARTLAGLVAALWAINPIQTQPVVYVVQRMTLLSALFSLMSFYFFLLWRSGTRGKWHLVLALTSWLLAVGSKENAFLLPVVFVIYEWLLTDRRLLRTRNVACGLIVFVCLVGFTFKRYDLVNRIQTDYSRREFTMKERLLTQPRILAFHISQMLLPLPSRLALRHEIEKSVSLTSPPTTILSIFFLGTVFAGCLLLGKRYPLVSFGFFWFFANLLVESSFLPLEMIYEHRMYLPSVGLVLALVLSTKSLTQISRTQLYCLLGVLIACSCGLSLVRTTAWQNEVSLWGDNVQKYPDSFRAWNNLGTAYAKAGDSSRAENAFRRALESNPEYPPSRVNLAILLKDEGRLEEAYSLIENFRELKIGSFSAEVYYNLGAIFAKKGILDWAIFNYGQAINRLPGYAEAYFNLALVYRQAGKTAEAKRSFELFLEHWRGPAESPFVEEAKRNLLELAR